MLDGGDRACAMEVSSHALELRRADAIEFAAAVFTNLTQDHLDFHPTMEDYFRAKRLLFHPAAGPPPAASIVNVGDPYGRRLLAELPDAITFAIDAEADYRADASTASRRLELHAARRGAASREVRLPLPGRYNVANALARWRRRARSGSSSSRCWARWSGACGCRAASRRWTRASPSPCSWTTPTRPTRSPTCCVAAREMTAGPAAGRGGCCACSAPGATATAPSGR